MMGKYELERNEEIGRERRKECHREGVLGRCEFALKDSRNKIESVSERVKDGKKRYSQSECWRRG